jgi:hypothetical protein
VNWKRRLAWKQQRNFPGDLSLNESLGAKQRLCYQSKSSWNEKQVWQPQENSPSRWSGNDWGTWKPYHVYPTNWNWKNVHARNCLLLFRQWQRPWMKSSLVCTSKSNRPQWLLPLQPIVFMYRRMSSLSLSQLCAPLRSVLLFRPRHSCRRCHRRPWRQQHHHHQRYHYHYHYGH